MGTCPRSPLGLLAELTHRCPLGCPYCSNPLALDPRDDELDTATWARVFREAAALGVLQVHLSGGEPGARRDLVEITAAAHDAGLYTNLITSAVGITADTLRSPMPGSITCRFRSRTATPTIRRPHRRLRRRLRAQARARRRGRAAENSAHRQRRHAPRQHRPHRRHGRAGARARRQPGRDRACAILRLGAEEPRRADAERASRSSAPPRRSRICASAITAASSSTPWCRTITRGFAKAVRRRLGPALAQCDARRQGAAVPRRRSRSRPRILVGARAFARRYLEEFAGLQRLPRHRLG